MLRALPDLAMQPLSGVGEVVHYRVVLHAFPVELLSKRGQLPPVFVPIKAGVYRCQGAVEADRFGPCSQCLCRSAKGGYCNAHRDLRPTPGRQQYERVGSYYSSGYSDGRNADFGPSRSQVGSREPEGSRLVCPATERPGPQRNRGRASVLPESQKPPQEVALLLPQFRNR